MWRQFWHDESGAIISAELAIILTVLVVALVAGLSSLRDGVVTELSDVGAAIGDTDQSFVVSGVQGMSSGVAGFGFNDNRDSGDQAGVVGQNSRGVVIATPNNWSDGPDGDLD